MASHPDDAVLERVRKLLELAKSPNEHEAELATARAQELMARHRLTLDDVAEDVVEIVDERADRCHEELARVVAALRGCAALVSRTRELAFRGDRRIVTSASAFYRSLVAAAEQGGQPDGTAPYAARQAWKLCFWLGFVDGVAGSLRGNDHEPDPEPSVFDEALEHLATIDGWPPRARTSTGISEAAAPPQVQEALDALGYLAECLRELRVEDVMGAVEQLRQDAHAAGRELGLRASVFYQKAGAARALAGQR